MQLINNKKAYLYSFEKGNYMTIFKRFIMFMAIFALVVPAVSSVAAQEAETPSLAIEEIIVTARKKEESIQDVPMAVTAITDQLRESSVRRIEDIQAFAPNLYINRTPGIASGAAITIRGVASLESDKSYEPSIGVVMDGMFLGTSSGVLLDNFDIERIEVLRGPQGTLFGKNTTGGALSFTTKKPVLGETFFDLQTTYGQYSSNDASIEKISGAVNFPIGDTMAVRISVIQDEEEGFYTNSKPSGSIISLGGPGSTAH